MAKNLDALTASFDKTGGIERFADYIFFQMTAINGFDGISHYLRAALIVNLCSAYAITPTPGCNANFTGTRAITAGAASAGKRDPTLENTRRVLAGEEAARRSGRAGEGRKAAARAEGSTSPAARSSTACSAWRTRRSSCSARPPSSASRTAANRGHSEQLDAVGGDAEPILDYLLGADR